MNSPVRKKDPNQRQMEEVRNACSMLGSEEGRGVEIVKGIRNEHMSVHAEIAVLRKTLAFVLEHLNLSNEEFDAYNAKVEEIKAEVKANEDR